MKKQSQTHAGNGGTACLALLSDVISTRALRGWTTVATVVLMQMSCAFAGVTARNTFTTAGTDQTWICPAGVYSVQIEAWGGGGAGGGATADAAVNVAGGGGGGGAYVRKNAYAVTPGTTYYINVPAAAAPNSTPVTDGAQAPSGGTVTFCTGTGGAGAVVSAPGGAGGFDKRSSTLANGAGGPGASATGYDAQYSGGNGNVSTVLGSFGTAGGGAGDSGNARDGGTSNSSGGAGGAGVFQFGGSGKTATAPGGQNGTNPGSGACGSRANNSSKAGGTGGLGMLALTYEEPALVVKANNTDGLNLGSSWTGGTVPDSTKAVKWDSTVTAANTVTLAANTTWKGITVVNPGGDVTINGGNTLTLNTSGNAAGYALDLAGATKDLTLNCPLALGANDLVSVTYGRTLTLAGAVSGSSGVWVQGPGTIKLLGPSTGGRTQTFSVNLTIIPGDLAILSDYNYGDGSTLSTAFGSPTCMTGGTVNFVCTGGTPGVNNNINLTQAAGFIDKGVFYNGAHFAAMNAINTYVRALNYATTGGDPNTVDVNTITQGKHVWLDNTTSTAGFSDFLSLKLSGAGSWVGGGALKPVSILKTGGGTWTISGGNGTQNSLELVIRTDAADDQLTFTGSGAAPSISGAVLVKSGLGTLRADGGKGVQLSGQLFVNGGTFEVNSGIAQTVGTGGTMTDATDVRINAGATLKIRMGSAFTGQTFSGVISGGGNLINASKVLTLSGANLFSGTTTVTGGLLTLGNAIALQNSTLDTANSPASSSPTTGLKTTMTTLTFGGLSGDKDFASLFNAANGYTTVTALTLNPSAGASPSYSGAIADGASGMTLTKTGAGTQTLSGANSYSGATTISAGTLKLGANNVLPSTAVSIGTAILDADIRTDTVGTLDVTGAAVINLGAGGTLAFANSRAINSGTWAGTLKISGSFVSGASIKFGTDNTGLTPAQLARISVSGVPTLMLNSNGYLSEVKGTLVSFF